MKQFLLASLAAAQASAWYDNGWLIGIVTGLVSGALLAAITPLFLRKRRARDLAIKRERAADDVLSALRPSVATGNLPSASAVEAIARASAYKRGLDPKLAVSTSTLLDVLVSEIMVSPFLAPETRLSLTKQLLGLSTELHDQVVLKQPLVGRGDDTAQTVIASLIGAVAIGGAAAASAVIGSWVPIVAALAGGVIVFLATSRITRFSLGELTFSLDEPEKSNGKEVAASDHQNAADS